MGIIKTIKRNIFYVKNIYLSKNFLIKDKKIIITGSNSGIGLSLLSKLSISNKILAFVNQNSTEVDKIIDDKTMIIKCDLSNPEDLLNYQERIINFKANVIFNCAATFGDEHQMIENIDLRQYQKIINVNCLSQFFIIQSSLKSKSLEIIVNLSSEMGSISSNNNGGHYFYRTTKSLLNSISKNLSIDLKEKKINVFCIHPGSVKTKLNVGGLIMPDIVAQKIINICAENQNKFSGIFIDIEKKILKW